MKKITAALSTQVGVLLIIDLLFMAGMSLLSPVFLTSANLLAMGVAMAGSVLASMGSTLVLLTGGFDLSLGTSYGLAGIMTALALLNGVPLWLAILLGLLTGTALGLLNGLLVTKLEINPFIATLGTMTIGRGLINILTQGYSISGLPPSFMSLIQAKIAGLPPSVVIMLMAVLGTELLLRYWRPARQLYYVGGSPNYARLIGINVRRITSLAYVIAGSLAAVGGLLFTARTGAASQQAGIGLEMIAILAPFLGGVGFGGEGTALGAFLGATLIALIVNAIQLLGLPVLWQNFMTGTFLIVAALIGMARVRRSARLQRRERGRQTEST